HYRRGLDGICALGRVHIDLALCATEADMNGRRVFRWCMVGAALIIGGVAVYFAFAYVATSIAVGNSGLKPFYQQSVRAMWLAFCAQLGLLAIVLLYAAAHPRGI